MNLILCARDEVDVSGRVHLTGDRARHVRDVLHAAPGQAIRVGIIDGPLGVGTVMAVADDAVDLACAFDDGVPERPAVDLLLAVPRPKVLRRLWAQLAAMGVGRIVLTNAARVERNYFDTHWLSPAAYRPLLVEGLQQARDTRLPLVTVHRQFRPLIEDALLGLVPNALRLVAHPGVAESIPDVIHDHSPQRVLLAVGPEGGWNAFELDLLASHGFVPAAMGLRTLRTDTACVAALALVHGALSTRSR
ncbi:MAG: RsmE family RNA methyltransferase [Acidobacteriota bacterium]